MSRDILFLLRDAANFPPCSGWSSQQGMILSKMSVVLRLRNLNIEQTMTQTLILIN